MFSDKFLTCIIIYFLQRSIAGFVKGLKHVRCMCWKDKQNYVVFLCPFQHRDIDVRFVAVKYDDNLLIRIRSLNVLDEVGL